MTPPSPEQMAEKMKQRFLSKVDQTGRCWVWTAYKVPGRGGAYGLFWRNGKNEMAHRVSFELFNHEIPSNLTVDHMCRNTVCVNPSHLRLLTLRDNILCGTSPSAIAAARTHCAKGHPYTPVYWRNDCHRRVCRPCKQAKDRKYWHSKHEH